MIKTDDKEIGEQTCRKKNKTSERLDGLKKING